MAKPPSRARRGATRGTTGAAPKTARGPATTLPSPPAIDLDRPISRPLKAYAFDPSQGRLLGNQMCVNVRYQDLDPGPVVRDEVADGIAVVDYDGANKTVPPVDLDDPRILLRSASTPPGQSAFHSDGLRVVTDTIHHSKPPRRRTLRRQERSRAAPIVSLPGDIRRSTSSRTRWGRQRFLQPRPALLFGYSAPTSKTRAQLAGPAVSLPSPTSLSRDTHAISTASAATSPSSHRTCRPSTGFAESSRCSATSPTRRRCSRRSSARGAPSTRTSYRCWRRPETAANRRSSPRSASAIPWSSWRSSSVRRLAAAAACARPSAPNPARATSTRSPSRTCAAHSGGCGVRRLLPHLRAAPRLSALPRRRWQRRPRPADSLAAAVRRASRTAASSSALRRALDYARVDVTFATSCAASPPTSLHPADDAGVRAPSCSVPAARLVPTRQFLLRCAIAWERPTGRYSALVVLELATSNDSPWRRGPTATRCGTRGAHREEARLRPGARVAVRRSTPSRSIRRQPAHRHGYSGAAARRGFDRRGRRWAVPAARGGDDRLAADRGPAPRRGSARSLRHRQAPTRRRRAAARGPPATLRPAAGAARRQRPAAVPDQLRAAPRGALRWRKRRAPRRRAPRRQVPRRRATRDRCASACTGSGSATSSSSPCRRRRVRSTC